MDKLGTDLKLILKQLNFFWTSCCLVTALTVSLGINKNKGYDTKRKVRS